MLTHRTSIQRHSVNISTNRLAHDKPSSKRSHRSNSSDAVTNLLPLYNNLQCKFTEFDDLPSLPLELPQTRPKSKRLRKDRKKNSDTRIEAEIQTTVRPHISTEDRVYIMSATAWFNTNKGNLGPGKYSVRQQRAEKGSGFTYTPRFNDTTVRTAEYFLEQKSKHSEHLIEKNKQVAGFSKEMRLKRIEEASRIRQFEETVHLRTKEALEHSRRDEMEKKYKEKVSKYEWRMKKHEIFKVKVAWGCLMCLSGIAFRIRTVIWNRLEEKVRVQRHFAVMGWLSRCVGKVMLRLHRFRYNKLSQALKKQRLHIIRWAASIRMQYQQSLLEIIERAMIGSYFSYLTKHFWSRVYFIQKCARSMLKIKRSRNLALMMLFSKMQTKIYSDKKGMKRHSKETHPTISNIEDEIRSYYLKTAKDHAGKLKDYLIKLSLYRKQVSKQLDDPKSKKIDNLPLPKKPIFTLYSKTEAILAHIRAALGIETSAKAQGVRRATTKLPQSRRLSALYK
jgi:hypothetical protein